MSEILFETKDNIATITLNRPEKLNAFAGSMRSDLLKAIQSVEQDSKISVLIITGTGRAFCAGGDITAMHQTQISKDTETFENWLKISGEIIQKLHALPKPVIAAVNGAAAGAGCGLALACDLRFASETATFSVGFIKLGLHPDWGTSYFLPRLIGKTNATEMMFTGKLIDAKAALQIGLINSITPVEHLMETVQKTAQQISTQSLSALAEIKKSLSSHYPQTLESALLRERDVQLELWASEESKNKTGSFR